MLQPSYLVFLKGFVLWSNSTWPSCFQHVLVPMNEKGIMFLRGEVPCKQKEVVLFAYLMQIVLLWFKLKFLVWIKRNWFIIDLITDKFLKPKNAFCEWAQTITEIMSTKQNLQAVKPFLYISNFESERRTCGDSALHQIWQ